MSQLESMNGPRTVSIWTTTLAICCFLVSIYYWLPLCAMIAIGLLIICRQTECKTAKYQIVISTYLMMQIMILLGMQMGIGIYMFLYILYVRFYICYVNFNTQSLRYVSLIHQGRAKIIFIVFIL